MITLLCTSDGLNDQRELPDAILPMPNSSSRLYPARAIAGKILAWSLCKYGGYSTAFIAGFSNLLAARIELLPVHNGCCSEMSH